MADFRGLEMATGYQYLDGVKVRSERRMVIEDHFRCLVATALLVVTTVALLMFGVCFWNQRMLGLENRALKEIVLDLESKINTVQVELTKSKGESDKSSDRSSYELFPIQKRLKRSNRNGEQKQKKVRDFPKAVHFRLDVDGAISTLLKWKIWTSTEAESVRTKNNEPKYLLTNSVRLSEDRTNVTIDESGLYFVYAQIHFENAKPRNAFAVKVDETPIMKCIQSLDYFNRSLTSADNTRFKPCYSASSVVLHRNQVVSVVNLYPHHRIYNDPVANFWGLVRLAE